MVQLVVTPDLWVSRIYPEGIIERWLVPDGTVVQANQPLAELRIEGDLIILNAPVAGKLLIDTHSAGPIEPGSVIGHIGTMSRA